jgi:hypothetical protein
VEDLFTMRRLEAQGEEDELYVLVNVVVVCDI